MNLGTKDKLLHGQALVSVLESLHDELDAAALEAYGWSERFTGRGPWNKRLPQIAQRAGPRPNQRRGLAPGLMMWSFGTLLVPARCREFGPAADLLLLLRQEK